MASRNERPDLFQGATGAYVTMGIATIIELQLIDAKVSVGITYHPIASISAAVNKIQHVTRFEDKVDYINGILYSKD